MRPLKDRGMRELGVLKRRAKRANALERISDADFSYINRRLEEVEARIVRMREVDEYGEEVLEPYAGEEAVTDPDPG